MPHRRWAIIDQEGVHVWLGSGAEPSPAALAAVPVALDSRGVAGWLIIVSGDYWGDAAVDVLAVRLLTRRECGSDEVVEAFKQRRARTLDRID